MRSYATDARPSRSLAAIFEEAVSVVRQDMSEYGYAALVGACTATIVTAILRMIGDPVSLALIPPVVAILATGTMATCAAALERAQSGLQPDSAQSFTDAIVRAPWLLFRIIPATVPFSAAILSTAWLGPELGRWTMAPVIVALAFVGIYMMLPLPAYVSALFGRDATPHSATVYAAAMAKSGRMLNLVTLIIVFAPALLAALLGVLAQFGAITSALLAFMVVISMPLCASMMALIYAETAPQLMSGQPLPPRQHEPAPDATARLQRFR